MDLVQLNDVSFGCRLFWMPDQASKLVPYGSSKIADQHANDAVCAAIRPAGDAKISQVALNWSSRHFSELAKNNIQLRNIRETRVDA